LEPWTGYTSCGHIVNTCHYLFSY